MRVPQPSRTLQLTHELPRGRHNLPREVIIRSQRERMIDAMIEAAVAHGYAHVTASDIVRGAGVSRKTFYEHFKDKEDCFVAAYDEIVGHLVKDATEVYAAQESWRRRVAAGLQVIVELLASRPKLARFCVIEILAAGPRALERRDDVMRQFAALVEPGANETPAGVTVPGLQATAVTGAIYSILFDEIRRDGGANLLGTCPDLVHIALAPYIGPRAAAREAARVKPAAG